MDNLLNISRLFADDTSVSSSSADVHEIKRSIEHDMNEILDWSVKWKVSFNPTKQKQKYRGMFETQKSRNKTSSGDIGLNIRTLASPKQNYYLLVTVLMTLKLYSIISQ